MTRILRKFLKPTVNTHKDLVIHDKPLRIFNIQSGKPKKTALISYLSQPVLDQLKGGTSVRFSNDGLATSWPHVLNQLGYSVDVINWDDTTYTFKRDYDLVISHGAINFDALSKQLRPSTPYIYFSTGSYWKFHNDQEQKRFKSFEKKHHVKLPTDRYIDYPEEAANKRADAIIALGNEALAETYKDFSNVYNIPIGSFTSTGHVKTPDELEAGRKDILFIAGAGNIHKGLDLVLDALADMPDFTLHIYTFLDDEFKRVYKKQLANERVKIYAFEAFPNSKFLDLTKKCNVAIMPSCSEGSPGSIVESMIQGLIPIVSHEAHIDVDGCGIILKHTTVNNIKEALENFAELPVKTLKDYSAVAHKIGTTRHSKAAYEKTLAKALKKALKQV